MLSTFAIGTPGANGVYLLGSHVSVCAIPPAIQSTMMVSSGCRGSRRRADQLRSRPDSAASVAAAPADMNPRRPILALMNFSSALIPAISSCAAIFASNFCSFIITPLILSAGNSSTGG